ncbi:50S ribosomal protein L30 [Candidatus Micrarchaeota archaeon]|nr:50S ribosomal protein L30 [Candidatus Micrarchaeota archaeon]
MKIAVLRIRGRRKIRADVEDSLRMLRLERPNHCVVIDDSPQNLGMIRKVKDYVAYGAVDEEIILKLLMKKGRKGRKDLSEFLKEDEIRKAAKEIFDGKKTVDYANPVFRLRPPSKGYKNIKKTYPEGDLGKRDDMIALLMRMM